ncbi:hypothetical protein PsYK624_024830 [Phanerochaete sordida]|uniref:Uncharacterized protein n=1 Tax=Phanerochaete sordida TaxID=48140 RepID=A0A9P3FZZ8_9APHY|nr:hypothetical protein PsYK624_024830 [Phanerochaete sordida]
MPAQSAIHALRSELNIPEDELANDDASVVLQSLLVAASQAQDPEQALTRFGAIVKSSEALSGLDAFSAVPTLLPLPYASAFRLLHDIARECSAKELIVVAQEQVARIQSLQEDEDDDDDEIPKGEESLSGQTERLLQIYAQAIPRLKKGKRTSEEVLEPIFSQLTAFLSTSAPVYTPQEAQAVFWQLLGLVRAVAPWATEGQPGPATDLLYSFIKDSLAAFANQLDGDIAQRALAKQFPRLVMPAHAGASEPADDSDVVRDAWDVLHELGIDGARIASAPGLAALMLLAHSQTPQPPSALTTFLPALLASLQTATALSSSLALLLTTLTPLTHQIPPPALAPELALPLAHLLPPIASAHPSPQTRHAAFRALGALLAACAPPQRRALLRGLLAAPDMPAPMRAAGVGLVKDAVLAVLGAPGAAPDGSFVEQFAGVLWRVDGPEGRDGEGLEAFFEAGEPGRLVESLGLLYVILQRDAEDKLGVRSHDVLRSLREEFLAPLKARLEEWNTVDLGDAAEARMQLQILDMWVHRVLDGVQQVEQGL